MAGESAQQVYERQRDNRRVRNRRMWRWTVVAVVVAFAVGWLLPIAFPSLLLSFFSRIGAGDEASFVIHRPPTAVSAFVTTMTAVVAVTKALAPSRSEVAWRKGAEGERAVGAALDALAGTAEVRTLHDRNIPGSRANIDHLAVTPAGVFTVDAKQYAGRLEVRGRGRQIWIKGRNRSKLLDQARRQAATVSAVLADAGMPRTPVTAILCFVGTELPVGPFAPKRVDGVEVTAPRKLRRWLLPRRRAALLTPQQMEQIVGVLEAALVPAARPADRAAPRPPPTRSASAEAVPRSALETGDVPTPSASAEALISTDGASAARLGTAPTCARCGQPMVARRRRSDDRAFYGCSAFPRCRSTAAFVPGPDDAKGHN